VGCPESYSEPMKIYRIAKQKGMSLVTITDHNCIEGALEIAHLADSFVSEEVTAFFPEDKCKVHVLVYNISEKQHTDIQKARQNLFELVNYLQQQKILHVLAHAHYSVNDRLTVENFEKLLLLFKNFELNGACNPEANELLKHILTTITQSDIDRLASEYNLAVKIPELWQKNLVGGSDDHSSFNVARTYTEVEGADSISSFLIGIQNNLAKVIQRPSSPQNLAHNIYSVAYQFYSSKFNLQRYMHKDVLLEMINFYLGQNGRDSSNFMRKLYYLWQQKRSRKNPGHVPQTPYDLMRKETLKLIDEDPSIISYRNKGKENLRSRENLWFDVINKVANRVISQFGNQMIDQISGANILKIFNTLASAGGMYTILAPYFVAFSLHAKQRQLAIMLVGRFQNGPGRNTNRSYPPKTAVFADSYKNLKNTVFISQTSGKARPKHLKNIVGITCDTERRRPYMLNVKNFEPIGIYKFSDTSDIQLFYPPVIDMLNFCYEQNVGRIHVLTPGPLGLAGLLVSRILKLPLDSTYQSAMPAYVHCMTKDEGMEHIFGRYSSWFYGQMDNIFTTSSRIARKLIKEGIQSEKIKIIEADKDGINVRSLKHDGFMKRRFHFPRNWRIYENASFIRRPAVDQPTAP
jgi:hypothetical protein